MIPEITFKEFINTLFEYTKTPINERGGFTALKNIIYNKVSYAYTWGEIEDYINRWLIKVPISKLDDEVDTAFFIMDKIVDDWYLINYKHEGGRSGYDDELLDTDKNINDFEDFHLHTKIREFIFLRAEEIKKEEEAKQREAKEAKQAGQKINKQGKKFEDYLSGIEEENKEQLMGTIKKLLSKNNHQTSFFVVMALQQAGYISQGEKFEDGFYEALNISFNTNFYSQVFSQYYENSKKDKKRDLYNKEIEQLKLELTQ